MSRGKVWLVAVIGCGVIVGPVSAQTIDQEQPVADALSLGHTGSDVGAPGYSQGWFTQSFTPAKTTSAGAAFYLGGGPTAGVLDVELWNKAPSIAGATMLDSGTTAVSSVPNWATVFFPTAAIVTPGNTYFLTFYSPQDYFPGANYGGYAGVANYNGSTLATDPSVGNGCCETVFIEYATAPAGGGGGPGVVPEPATMTLLATGLVGIVGAGVRRRKKA